MSIKIEGKSVASYSTAYLKGKFTPKNRQKANNELVKRKK